MTTELLKLMSVTLCHANRIGHLNRVLSDVRSLRKLIKAVFLVRGDSPSSSSSSSSMKDYMLRIQQKANSLCTSLTTKRHYMTGNAHIFYNDLINILSGLNFPFD